MIRTEVTRGTQLAYQVARVCSVVLILATTMFILMLCTLLAQSALAYP
jgi:hypothetical protein